MTAVWYIGDSNSRKMTVADWANVGVSVGYDTVWDASNGWSVPTGQFNAQQLLILDADDRFLLDQADGPRTSPSPPPDLRNDNKSAFAYYTATKALSDVVTADGGAMASSKARRIFSGIHQARPWWFPHRSNDIAPAADIPTYAQTDSTVGGASAAYTSMPGGVTGWNSSRLTKYGYTQGTRTVATVGTFPNVCNGRIGVANFAPKWTPTPYFVGTVFDGTVMRFADMIVEAFYTLPFRLWVDGRYAGEFQMGAVTGAAQRYSTLTWGTARLRRLVFEFPRNYQAVSFGSPDNNSSFGPLPKLPFRVGALGDSWFEGAGFTTTTTGNLEVIPELLMLKTGWEVFNCGQGGTGPGAVGDDDNATSAAQTYNSPARIRGVTEVNPHLLLIHGTSNVDGIASSTLPGFLNDLYAKLKAAAPNALLMHVGPQVMTGTQSAPRLANRDACAAAAAANGVIFIDPIAEQWIIGSGTWGTPVNGGNASLYYGGSAGADSAHLRNYEHYTDRMVESLYRQVSLAA